MGRPCRTVFNIAAVSTHRVEVPLGSRDLLALLSRPGVFLHSRDSLGCLNAPGTSWLGELTKVPTGVACISSAGYGCNNGSRSSAALSLGSSHRSQPSADNMTGMRS